MATKKVLKITPILIALNILVLLVIIGFYTFRLIKYYLIENGNKYDENTFLVDVIKKKQSFLDDTKGLVLNEETGVFTYKGDVDDNYVSYSGLLYRILNIDKNGSVSTTIVDEFSGVDGVINASLIAYQNDFGD